MINFTWVHASGGIAILIVTLLVLWKQKHSFSYLFCFSIFWVYLIYVVSVVVFPFVIVEKHDTFRLSVNFIPFYFGTCEIVNLCIYNIVGNILLTMPFGFGISFIAQFDSKSLPWLALAVGATLELSQLIISLVYQSAFRSVDVNDVILNALGVILGYGIFKLFGGLYSYVTDRFEIRPKYIFAYLYDVVHRN